MGYAAIRAEAHGEHVTRIVLDRPERMNAYTSELCGELVDALAAFAGDDARRVLVLTGAGRAFCAGGDVGDAADLAKAHERQLGHAAVMREGMHAVARALWECDKPTIAAIDGPAVAGGLTLALLCDLRIASERARLGDPSGNVGLLPDEGGAWLFPRAMGLEAAMRMTLLGETYDAHRARELGLVGEVVEHERLEARSLELAGRLAARAPLAVRLAKDLMRRGLTSGFETALRDAQAAVMIANESADAREGVTAFLQKRPPSFEGR